MNSFAAEPPIDRSDKGHEVDDDDEEEPFINQIKNSIGNCVRSDATAQSNMFSQR